MTAFLRLKLLEAVLNNKPNEPFCAVAMKELVKQDDGTVTLEQKKKTFYPEWDHCFDSHLRPGRKMQIIIMERQPVEAPLAEVTVETEALAQECMSDDPANAVKLAVRSVIRKPFIHFVVSMANWFLSKFFEFVYS